MALSVVLFTNLERVGVFSGAAGTVQLGQMTDYVQMQMDGVDQEMVQDFQDDLNSDQSLSALRDAFSDLPNYEKLISGRTVSFSVDAVYSAGKVSVSYTAPSLHEAQLPNLTNIDPSTMTLNESPQKNRLAGLNDLIKARITQHIVARSEVVLSANGVDVRPQPIPPAQQQPTDLGD